ncbi:MAG TPA: hypothetical protein PLC25_03420, partial [Bacilli bacterium]|nr:hypothetical protein [Bacilli bacterium]
ATGEIGTINDSISSWYQDYSAFIENSGSWFVRGGAYIYNTYAGSFYFSGDNGAGGSAAGSRMVLSPEV